MSNNGDVVVNAAEILDQARRECRSRGFIPNPNRLGTYVGRAGYTPQEVPAPYTNPQSIRQYAGGNSWGLTDGGKKVRRERIDAARGASNA